jgi:hypothetical protein
MMILLVPPEKREKEMELFESSALSQQLSKLSLTTGLFVDNSCRNSTWP